MAANPTPKMDEDGPHGIMRDTLDRELDAAETSQESATILRRWTNELVIRLDLLAAELDAECPEAAEGCRATAFAMRREAGRMGRYLRGDA